MGTEYLKTTQPQVKRMLKRVITPIKNKREKAMKLKIKTPIKAPPKVINPQKRISPPTKKQQTIDNRFESNKKKLAELIEKDRLAKEKMEAKLNKTGPNTNKTE